MRQLPVRAKRKAGGASALREAGLLALGFGLFVALPAMTLSAPARTQAAALTHSAPIKQAALGPGAPHNCRYEATPVRDRFGETIGWRRAPVC